jgi:predicted amidohydrolase
MSNASNSGVQIIVFPEYGLYSPLLVSRYHNNLAFDTSYAISNVTYDI